MSAFFSESDIEHDSSSQQFKVSADGETALLQYRRYQFAGQAMVDFYHTFVPTAWRGRQVAALLTDHAIHWAATEGLQPTASCSYVAARLRRSAI